MIICEECEREFDNEMGANTHWRHQHDGPNPYSREHSDTTKKRLSEIHTGRSLSGEHRNAISDGLKGHDVSEEARENLRDAMTGNLDPTAEIRETYPTYSQGQWLEITAEIRERDGGECVDCGITNEQFNRIYGYNLPVHHIDGDRANIDDSNLITVCHSCHIYRHQNDLH